VIGPTAEVSSPGSVSRRELKILACISLGTIVLMALLAEVVARVMYRQQETTPCFLRDQVRPVAGCTAIIKGAEAPWITMAFNECGYRSGHSCRAKPSGARRIVLLGKSISAGAYVRYEEFFGTRLERSLAQRCGFPVETQSLGSLQVTLDRQTILLREAISLDPDVAILPLEPFDLTYFGDETADESAGAAASEPADATDSSLPPASTGTGGMPWLTPLPLRPEVQRYTVLTQLRLLSRESRALLVAQHFMLLNDNFLIRAYKLRREEDALRVPHSESYQRRYTRLETELRALSARLSARGVPLLLVAIPNRIQAALISDRTTLPGVDPWAFTRELQAIGQRTGVRVADTFPRFAARPHAEQLFYAVDGHPTGEANALIGDAVEQALLEAPPVPAFRGCRPIE
jgi:hypothetical protein